MYVYQMNRAQSTTFAYFAARSNSLVCPKIKKITGVEQNDFR